MSQAIDPARLKAAAENLERVLKQYPDNHDVQGLLRSMTPLIESAKDNKIFKIVDRRDVPGRYDFGDGLYMDYNEPSVDGAYADFLIELGGGLTDEDRQRMVKIEGMRKAIMERPGHGQ